MQLRFVTPPARRGASAGNTPEKGGHESCAAAGEGGPHASLSSPGGSPRATGPKEPGGGVGEPPGGSGSGDVAEAQRKRLYLQGDIRVVFPVRRPDMDMDCLTTETDAPDEYFAA